MQISSRLRRHTALKAPLVQREVSAHRLTEGLSAQIMPKFPFAYRRRGAFCKGVVGTARRGGVPFTRVKGTKTRLGLRPKTPVARLRWIRICFSAGAEKQIHTARRWASKEPAAHFYRPRAGARKGEPPPLSPPLRRGTMEQVKQILYSPQNRFLGKI